MLEKGSAADTNPPSATAPKCTMAVVRHRSCGLAGLAGFSSSPSSSSKLEADVDRANDAARYRATCAPVRHCMSRTRAALAIVRPLRDGGRIGFMHVTTDATSVSNASLALLSSTSVAAALLPDDVPLDAAPDGDTAIDSPTIASAGLGVTPLAVPPAAPNPAFGLGSACRDKVRGVHDGDATPLSQSALLRTRVGDFTLKPPPGDVSGDARHTGDTGGDRTPSCRQFVANVTVDSTGLWGVAAAAAQAAVTWSPVVVGATSKATALSGCTNAAPPVLPPVPSSQPSTRSADSVTGRRDGRGGGEGEGGWGCGGDHASLMPQHN